MTDDNSDDKATSSAADGETEEVHPKAALAISADGGDMLADDAAADALADASQAEGHLASQLGAGTRYVLAGFFAAGMAVAFVIDKVINASWNKLASNPWLSQHVPFLSRVAEEDRPTLTLSVGAFIALWLTVYAYRRPDVRAWTSDVASELAKVSWPSKKEVTNSTMVVVVTSAFATVFLALLDRFWGFVTNLVYGS